MIFFPQISQIASQIFPDFKWKNKKSAKICEAIREICGKIPYLG
jgi:hypothetical protein